MQQTASQALPQPPEVVWFGIERDVDGKWWRAENANASAKNRRWWKVTEGKPEQVAATFGAGLYRVIWTGTDRRTTLSRSEPFAIEPPDQGDGDDFDGLELVDPRAAAPQAPAQAAPVAPPAQAAAVVPGVLFQPDQELQRFTAIHQLVHADYALQLERERQQALAAIAAERERSKVAIEQTRAYFQAVEQQRQQLQAMALAMQGKQEEHQGAQLAAVTQQLAQLGAKLEEFEQDDGPDQAAQLAQLSQNPNDLERIVTTIANVANSPLGEVIGQMLHARMGGGSIEGAEAIAPPHPGE